MPIIDGIDLRELTISVAAIVIIIGGFRGWFIYGPQHDRQMADKQNQLDEAKADRDYWRDVALDALGVAEKSVNLAARRTDD